MQQVQTLFELLRTHGREAPERPFLTDLRSRSVHSYGELADSASRVAAALSSKGLAPGSRVAFISQSNWFFFPLLAACCSQGLILVPINPQLHQRELGHILQDSGPG